MIFEYIKLSFQDLLSNKLRSFLSLIGIVIGVALVYTIFSIADITEYAITQQLTGENGIVTLQFNENTDEDNLLLLSMQSLLNQEEPLEYRFTNDDVEELCEINGVLDALGNYSTTTPFSIAKSKPSYSNVIRYTDNYINFYTYVIKAGHDLSVFTDAESLSIALVDVTFVDENTTYTYEEIIGETIQMNNRVFIVVGVLEKESTLINAGSTIFLNSTAYDSIFSKGTMKSISIKVDPRFNLELVSTKASSYLNEKYGTENQYEIQDLSFLISQITSVTGILSMIMGIIALVSLAVAGIGIMNIMYVSVIERTREIAVKRAIGASKFTIQIQFIVESCTLTFIGGLLGVFLGIGIVQLALLLLNFAMPINMNYILYAIIFSTSLGIAFGFLPAKYAANLNITQAIGAE